MVSPTDALQRLREGNARFVAGTLSSGELASPQRRGSLSEAQKPFAIVLGCSDSRVPAELVFDQGLGDLFVIRVAGNVVTPSGIGSVEFAAEQFGTRLVVVLGHSKCGAVKATLGQLQQPAELRSPNLRSIVDRIQPSVEPVLDELGGNAEDLVQQAVDANVRSSVEQLCHGSEILEQMVDNGTLQIVGANYCLDSGEVTFFEGDES